MEKINDMAEYLFHQGTNYRAYEYLGAHKTDDGYVFRVWAPNADKVFLAGDFNDWGEDAPLECIRETMSRFASSTARECTFVHDRRDADARREIDHGAPPPIIFLHNI